MHSSRLAESQGGEAAFDCQQGQQYTRYKNLAVRWRQHFENFHADLYQDATYFYCQVSSMSFTAGGDQHLQIIQRGGHVLRGLQHSSCHGYSDCEIEYQPGSKHL